MDLIGELWKRWPLFLPRSEFEKSLQGWDIEPVQEGEKVVGAFLIRGPELHFSKFDGMAASKRHLDRLAKLIEQHGYAITRTPKNDLRMCRFNQRTGWVQVGQDDQFIHFRIENMRGRPCR